MDDCASPPLRTPRTKEDVALILASRPLDDDENDEYYDVLGNLLFDSIYKMVYGLAGKYVWGCPGETVEDLSNHCFYRIMDKISMYDPERGAFNTWAFRVTQSVLNKRYRRGKRYKNLFCEENPDIETAAIEGSENGISELEIARLVLDLISTFPEQSEILKAMFGDPQGSAFAIPYRLNMADVARRSGAVYNDVRVFYRYEVKPRMSIWLKEMRSEQEVH